KYVKVEQRREPVPAADGLLVEREPFGRVERGADQLPVAAARAASGPALLDDADVADAAVGQLERERQAVHARADHDGLVGALERAGGGARNGHQPASCPSRTGIAGGRAGGLRSSSTAVPVTRA